MTNVPSIWGRFPKIRRQDDLVCLPFRAMQAAGVVSYAVLCFHLLHQLFDQPVCTSCLTTCLTAVWLFGLFATQSATPPR